MILHAVLLSMKASAEPRELADIMSGLASLCGQLDGFELFEHGENIDLEDKSSDYAYGFMCRFRDRKALDAYASDRRHQALGARLVGLCDGGGDGIMVFDIETGG